jgi:hypothetical protein
VIGWGKQMKVFLGQKQLITSLPCELCGESFFVVGVLFMASYIMGE